MEPNVRGVCRDCDQVTSGRCWRHASVTYLTGKITIIPTKITVVPIVYPIEPPPKEVP